MIPFLGIPKRKGNTPPHKNLYTNAGSNIICISLQMETQSPSTGEWINKRQYIHKSEYPAALKGMNLWYTLRHGQTLTIHAKWSKPDTKGQIAHESTYTRHLDGANSETESETEGPRDWQSGGMGSSGLLGREFQRRLMKKFWQWIIMMVAQHCELYT